MAIKRVAKKNLSTPTDLLETLEWTPQMTKFLEEIKKEEQEKPSDVAK